jgi:protein required for attachment to host cells
MKTGIWVVVADATCARIFSAANHSAELIEQKDLLHSASRVPSATLTSDRSGRDTDIQHTGSHTMGHEKSAMNQEAHNFAREISKVLEQHRQKNHFYRLYLLASPRILGLLRKELSSETQKIIAGETDLNLVKETLSTIRNHLPKQL